MTAPILELDLEMGSFLYSVQSSTSKKSRDSFLTSIGGREEETSGEATPTAGVNPRSSAVHQDTFFSVILFLLNPPADG